MYLQFEEYSFGNNSIWVTDRYGTQYTNIEMKEKWVDQCRWLKGLLGLFSWRHSKSSWLEETLSIEYEERQLVSNYSLKCKHEYTTFLEKAILYMSMLVNNLDVYIYIKVLIGIGK